MGGGCSAKKYAVEVDISQQPAKSLTEPYNEASFTAPSEATSSVCGKQTRVAIFSAAPYVHSQMGNFAREFPNTAFIDAACGPSTAHLCAGAPVVCLFVNDDCSKEVINIFASAGVKLIALRCANSDKVDLAAAEEAGIKVVRVPAYSPYAVAEHAVSLAMCLNRRIHRARNRVRDGNYNLNGLVGVDLYGKTCGIVGTGEIGCIAASIFKGMGLHVLCYDVSKNDKITEIGCEYVELDELYARSDIVSLHIPLQPATHKLINAEAVGKMKKGVSLINCSRGGLVSTGALIEGLISGKLGSVGLDVYDKEQGLFFQDLSTLQMEERFQKWDSKFALLRSFPNVLVTPHTAFLTQEALDEICTTTIQNVEEFVTGKEGLTNAVGQDPQPTLLGLAHQSSRLSTKAVADDFLCAKIAKAVSKHSKDAAAALPVYDGSTRIIAFSAQHYVVEQLAALKQEFPSTLFIEQACTVDTASLANGAQIVCLFVNDEASGEVIEIFKEQGVKLIVLRCAGFDRVDLQACAEAGIKVARVPAYSPHAVAEHAVSLFVTLNRKLHLAYNRVKEGVFTSSGLVGMDCKGKVAGIIGTGLIGCLAAKAFKALGMKVIGYNRRACDDFCREVGTYVELDELYQQADVISLHLPLVPATHHIINRDAIQKMKRGVFLINCARGGLVDTLALIEGLESGKFGGVGLDVYENEAELFFQDFCVLSDQERVGSWDNMMAMLRSFPNVIVTPHSAFLTQEALRNICGTTAQNIKEFLEGKELTNVVKKT